MPIGMALRAIFALSGIKAKFGFTKLVQLMDEKGITTFVADLLKPLAYEKGSQKLDKINRRAGG